jgi:oligopeptide transport system substrate-binding protein
MRSGMTSRDAISAVLAVLLLLSGCGGGERRATGDLPEAVVARRIASAHLNRHIQSSPATLDPSKSQDVMGFQVISDLYEGLIRQDAAGNLVPGVAERWELSPDGLLWRFHLRRGSLWSNGDPVTAADFVFSLRRVVDPATASLQAQQMAPIAGAVEISAGRAKPETLGVTAVDPHTLDIRLAEPTPYFLTLLINSYFMPLHAASVTAGGVAWTQPDNIITNGPFLLKVREINGRVELAKNPRYWDAAAVRLVGVTYFPLTDNAASTARFLAGDLDMTDRFQVDDLQWLRESLGEGVRIAPYIGTVMMAMHTQRPPFDNVDLRRAMVLALDRDLITDQLFKGIYAPAYGIVPPLPGYEPVVPSWSKLDRASRHALARELYAKAGYSKDKPLEVQMTFPSGNNEFRRLFEAMEAMWRMNLGARVQLVSEEFRVHQQNRRIGKLQLFWDAWIGDYPEPMTFLWLALRNNPQNYMRFDNEQFEQAMAGAIASVDLASRNALYQQAERILDEQAPFLPVMFYQSRHLLRSYVQGWQDTANDLHLSRDLYLAERPDP